jgi:predicted DNA-binding mobile mystery protein A
MKAGIISLQRNQIDRQLKPLRQARLARPARGWVRAVREALGINGRQMAERMKVARSHVSQVEDAEARGAASIRTLQRAADALGCDLVYALVPHGGKTLETLVHDRARRTAERMVERVAGTMALEDQEVSREFRKREVDRIAGELVRTMSKVLWDE